MSSLLNCLKPLGSENREYTSGSPGNLLLNQDNNFYFSLSSKHVKYCFEYVLIFASCRITLFSTVLGHSF